SANASCSSCARPTQGIESKSSWSLLRGVSLVSSPPGRCSRTDRSGPTSLSTPGVIVSVTGPVIVFTVFVTDVSVVIEGRLSDRFELPGARGPLRIRSPAVLGDHRRHGGEHPVLDATAHDLGIPFRGLPVGEPDLLVAQ